MWIVNGETFALFLKVEGLGRVGYMRSTTFCSAFDEQLGLVSRALRV